MELGLIGYPLGHSKSPEIFAQIFKQNNVEGSYSLFPLEDSSTLKQWLATPPNLAGFNVTIPHKKAILPFLDLVSADAEAIGAINTVKITRKGNTAKLIGYNTDYLGFKTSLLNFLGAKKPQKALVLGTGGSAKAVGYTLVQLGIPFSSVSRSKTKEHFSYEELSPDIINSHHLIINTTPLGMAPNIKEYPSIDYNAITPNHFLYDLVYNPLETRFLSKGKAQGAKIKNGLEMLHLQAQYAWEIWNS